MHSADVGRDLLLLAFTLSFAVANATPIAAEVGIAHVSVSGVRSYAAPGLKTSTTHHKFTPFIRLSHRFTKDFSIGLGYCQISGLNGKGRHNSSDVFNTGGVALMMIVDYTSTERIHDIHVDARYSTRLSKRVYWELSPVVSLLQAKAKISYREFSSSEVRAGCLAAIGVDLGKWTTAVSCRLLLPHQRELVLVGLSSSYRF